MFTVKHKKTGKVYTVYSAIPELNTTWFLFYEDNMWSWRKSNHYEPYDFPIINAPYTPTPVTPWWQQPWYGSITTSAHTEYINEVETDK